MATMLAGRLSDVHQIEGSPRVKPRPGFTLRHSFSRPVSAVLPGNPIRLVLQP